MKKVCFVTGTRAEFGLLSGVMRQVQKHPRLELQIIATNMHLSPEYGLTYKEIEQQGFRIDYKVHMLLSADTANSTTKSVGLGTIGFADAYEVLQPDIIVVLGDRYEILAAVSAALFYQIPVAHLHGGEATEGAYDECIRHAVTKMSHLHFAATESYRQRIIQLGESPERVFCVGAPGVENIHQVPLLSKEELEAGMGFSLGDKSLLVTYHPVTLGSQSAALQCKALLHALENYPEYKLVFTMPNSDTNGRIIATLLQQYAAQHPERAAVYSSLGMQRYLSALQFVSAVVGNSSSGIIEVPSFGIPTLDIGPRQQGRIAAGSVHHCGSTREEIEQGLQRILSPDFRDAARQISNPYDIPHTSSRIVQILAQTNLDQLTIKHFYNLH